MWGFFCRTGVVSVSDVFTLPLTHVSPTRFLSQAIDKHGFTPLICACYESNAACVEVLLEKVGTLHLHLHTEEASCPSPAAACVCVRDCADEVTYRTKGSFNSAVWRPCWNVHTASHIIAALHLFCGCY